MAALPSGLMAWTRDVRTFTKVLVLLLLLVVGVVLFWNPDEGGEGREHFASRPRSKPATPYDWVALRRLWHARIEEVERRGVLPLLDIESSFSQGGFATDRFISLMDQLGVAIIAFGSEGRPGWRVTLRTLVEERPRYFIPLPVASLHEHVTSPEDANAFLDRTFAAVLQDGYPMMGEFFFRHYPSNVQQLSDRWQTIDVHIPIDGPYANRVFAFAQEHDLPFEIHYEVEDGLLPPLDKMLSRYPGARVIWCHLGRVRFGHRGRRYTAEYVRDMLARHPNLYFDISCSDAESVWPRKNGERVSRMWDENREHLRPEWVDVVSSYPDRFLAAFDLGTDRLDERHLVHYDACVRRLLGELPADVRSRVAYRNAWRLLFREEF